jgi:hypothetical protein
VGRPGCAHLRAEVVFGLSITRAMAEPGSEGARSSSPIQKSVTPPSRSTDARLTIARYCDFPEWPAVAAYVEAVSQEGPVFEFESAVEAVVKSDLAALEDAIRRNPALVRARSSRICCFDPADAPRHLAPLRRRQWGRRIPPKDDPNAVEIARALLQAGAEPDALADMYGAEPECTTMSMLVSSNHPAEAGLQVPLLELLLDFGAAIEGRGTRKWSGPLFTALAFGISDAVKLLAKRKARIDLPTAAGMGLAPAGSRPPTPKRHRALSLAAQRGDAEIVRLLLLSGEDPNRYNPEGTHAHSTPLHQRS